MRSSVDKWGLEIPSSIMVAKETDHAMRFSLGRLHQMIQIESNPRSRAVHTIDLNRLETLRCIDLKGRPCKGIDMVRRFNNERTYGERVKRAAGIVLGLRDRFDLRHYTPVDARMSRHIPDFVGVFDHLMSRLGIPKHREYGARFFMDGSLFTTPSGAEQWTVYAQKLRDGEGRPNYACNLCPARCHRAEHDYSLVLG